MLKNGLYTKEELDLTLTSVVFESGKCRSFISFGFYLTLTSVVFE